MKIHNNSNNVELIESDNPWFKKEHYSDCNKKSKIKKKKIIK